MRDQTYANRCVDRCTVQSLGCLILLALSALNAQQNPNSGAGRAAIDAARAKELLASSQTVDKAWGAYAAGQIRDPALHEILIEHLRRAGAYPVYPVPGAGDRYPPEVAYSAALFDALIQEGGAVPPDLLMPFLKRWPFQFAEQALILLSRSKGIEDALLSLANRPEMECSEPWRRCGSDLDWLAINDLLLAVRSKRFFTRTLEEIDIKSTFEICDHPPYQPIEVPVGKRLMAEGRPAWPPGFPPAGLYYLEDRQPTGGVLLVPGIHSVYYLRVVPPARYDEGFENPGRQRFRTEFLASWNHRNVEEATEVFAPVTTVMRPDAATLERVVRERLDAQEAAIRAYVAEARKNGAPDLTGVKLKIVPLLEDCRFDKSQRLPEARAPREITLR